jgi:simple sugar transport system permease protein/D-xylose transport system permease protein
VTALEQQQEEQAPGVRGWVADTVSRVSAGDLGSIPVIIGLIVIWATFQILNPTFLSSTNLVNLTMQCAAVGTMAIGIVLVLLIGEIDLSVGSVSGLASAILAVAFVQNGLPLVVAILLAVAAGAVAGLIFGLLRTAFGVPSFVITLAGLLGFLGVQLYVLGARGSINIPFESSIVQFAQQWFLPAWASYVVVGLAVVVYAGQHLSLAARRTAAGLTALSRPAILVRAGIMLVLLGFAAWYLNLSRGVGAMFLLFLLLVVIADYFLTRSAWGRAVHAIGGNVEAARRAGIRVNRIYISVFVICSTLAAVGGVLAAARLGAANQSSGGTDTSLNAIAAAVIGGTSLFGGRGSAYSAVLGILVIMSITSGLALLNLDSSIRYMITGVVLVLAVVVDALSRRSRAAAGRA